MYEYLQNTQVLSIQYDEECARSLPRTCAPASLQYETSVSSELWPHMGINDVVEAAEDKVYVTQWKANGFPAGGKANPTNLADVLKIFEYNVGGLFGIRKTRVFVCTISSSECEVATPELFVGANGITINKARDVLFVNDHPDKKITVFNIDPRNYKLKKAEVIKLDFNADNIEYDDETGDILIGASLYPQWIDALVSDLKNELTRGFLKGEGGGLPGGLAVASPVGKGAKKGWHVQTLGADGKWHPGKQKSFLHNGSKVKLCW